jgi:DNA-binding NarL/FixJ family response regulator
MSPDSLVLSTLPDEAPSPARQDRFRPTLRLVPIRPADPVGELTQRERQVLALVAEGRSNNAICAQLFISPKTLERHVQHIFTKLDLPPCADQHRRVRAVLAWLRSPLSEQLG